MTTRAELENREMVALNLCVHALRGIVAGEKETAEARPALEALRRARADLQIYDRYQTVREA